MAFTLNTSVLGDRSYRVTTADMEGSFFDLAIRFYQNDAGADLEIHFFEVHLTVTGDAKEA